VQINQITSSSRHCKCKIALVLFHDEGQQKAKSDEKSMDKKTHVAELLHTLFQLQQW